MWLSHPPRDIFKFAVGEEINKSLFVDSTNKFKASIFTKPLQIIMAQRPRSNSAGSDSSNDSAASDRDGFAETIVPQFQVDISEDNLNALKAEERERVMLCDTKLVILNSNQFHWKAQNLLAQTSISQATE